jgi:hypothetical protein
VLLGVPVSFALFELFTYVLLCLCVWHALHLGALRRARLIELGIGVLYGLTLEALTLLQFHAYRYGHFLIMFGPVPLTIGVSWGIILYSAVAFADTFALPAWAAPALVGLLGLNIDLSMDAVAIRLQMWQWIGVAYDQQWFGVPYGNFFAWFIVLSSSSALFWLARPLTARPGWRGLLAGLGALLGSVVILTLLDELEVQYVRHGGIIWLPVALIVAGAMIVVIWGMRAKRSSTRSPAVETRAFALVPAIVPFYFHVLFLTMLFVTGTAARLPALVVISLAMLAVSLAFHVLMLQRLRLVRVPASSVQETLLKGNCTAGMGERNLNKDLMCNHGETIALFSHRGEVAPNTTERNRASLGAGKLGRNCTDFEVLDN